MKKRLLAIIATAAMVVTMIPAMAFADSTVVAKVGEAEYTDLQEAIKAAAPSGTVEIVEDVTVDKWIMFSETLSIGNGNIITLNIDGLTINGNGHTLTINDIESAGNGNRLFYDAENLNIKNLTIKQPSGSGGIGLKSGVLDNVTFDDGCGVFPQEGEIEITNCTFNTDGFCIYYEEARDNLTVSECTFNVPEGINVILLRGDTVFKNNIINSGRTVNVVSGSPEVSGNTFNNDVRLKVYNDATAKIENNKGITNLEFNEADKPANSTFKGNELGEDAKAALEAVGGENEPADTPSDEGNTPAPTPGTPSEGTTGGEAAEQPAPEEPAEDVEEAEDAVDTGDNMNMAIPFGIAGLALAAMAAVVATRRRTN